VVKFKKLNNLAIKKIVLKFIDELQGSLSEKNIFIHVAEPVVDLLVEKGYDNKMGARPLNRKIDELIRVPLSKKILFEKLRNCEINVVLIKDTIDFIINSKDVASTLISSESHDEPA